MATDKKSEAIRKLRSAFNHIESKASFSAVLRKEEELALADYREAFGHQAQLSPLLYPWPQEALPFAKPNELESIAKFRAVLNADILTDPDDENYCSDLRLYQYLKARDFDVDKAMKMLVASLQWRRKARPWEIESIESRTNSRVSDARVIGFDKQKRVVVYSSFANTDKRDPKDVPLCVMAVLEKAAKISPNGSVGSVVWVNNVSLTQPLTPTHRYPQNSHDHHPLNTLMQFSCRHKNGFGWKDCNPKFLFSGITLFADRYPEALATMMMVDTPAIFLPLWNTVFPFIPEKTQKKASFLDSRKGEQKVKEILRQTFEDEMVDFLWDQIIRDS